jgi:hypothetical protein
MGKVTKETKGIPSSSVNREFYCFPNVKSTNFPSIFENFVRFLISQIYKYIYKLFFKIYNKENLIPIPNLAKFSFIASLYML